MERARHWESVEPRFGSNEGEFAGGGELPERCHVRQHFFLFRIGGPANNSGDFGFPAVDGYRPNKQESHEEN